MTFDKPIIIQTRDEATELWIDLYSIHAKVNKSGGSEYLGSGANRSMSIKVFEVRYFKELENIDRNRGMYRILYRGYPYNIVDYDDYMEQHKTVKLLGECT